MELPLHFVTAGMKRTFTFGAALAGLTMALAIVTLALSGCSTLGQALNIVAPTYSFRDIRPRVDIALPLSASSIDFDFTVGVNNPNSVRLNLSRMDFGLLINGNHILDSYTTDRIGIPARGEGDVHLRARVGYQNIQGIFREVTDVIQGNRARYEVRGTAYYNTPAGQLSFPVTVYSTAR